MSRRRFVAAATTLAALVLGSPWWPARAHTPYRQWSVFRSRHLQIGTSRQDLAGDASGERWAEALRTLLPLSRALVTRAATVADLCSLLKTDQIRLAVLSHSDLVEVVQGHGPYASLHPMPLQCLVDDGRHLLAARDNLPLHHGFLVTSALAQAPLALRVPPAPPAGLAIHPGALVHARGESLEMPTE